MSRTKRTMGSFVAFLTLLTSLTLVFAAEKSPSGEKIYKTKCASCHGADGKGDTKAGKVTQTPDLTKTPWKHGSSQADVEKIIREGSKKMLKSEGKLDNSQITAVAKYVRKLVGIDK